MATIDFIKQRARSIFASINRVADRPTLSHSLNAVAQAEGFGNYQALLARAESVDRTGGVPFCPHCGSFGTMEAAGTVFCEQGAYRNGSYEEEGDATHYRCSRCGGQCADWSSDIVDAPRASDESFTAVVFIKPQPDELPVLWQGKVYGTRDLLEQYRFLDVGALDSAAADPEDDLLYEYHHRVKYELLASVNVQGSTADDVLKQLRADTAIEHTRCHLLIQGDKRFEFKVSLTPD